MLFFLIGMPGSGKSTFGPAIARALNAVFVDTDKDIEKQDGRKIKDIFAQDGEEAFRQMEVDMLQDCLMEAHAVIATGGGMATHSGLVDTMLAHGVVIRLQPDKEQVLERISGEGIEKRPLFHGCESKEDVRKRFNELLDEREKFYSRAHITVNDPDTVVELIKKLSQEMA